MNEQSTEQERQRIWRTSLRTSRSIFDRAWPQGQQRHRFRHRGTFSAANHSQHSSPFVRLHHVSTYHLPPRGNRFPELHAEQLVDKAFERAGAAASPVQNTSGEKSDALEGLSLCPARLMLKTMYKEWMAPSVGVGSHGVTHGGSE